jgi:hypothetical protein
MTQGIKWNVGMLHSLYEEWRRWAEHQRKDEDGWEVGFPKFQELMSSARQVIVGREITDSDLLALEKCFAISEETEDLLQFLRLQDRDCTDLIRRLLQSSDPKVRWQVYAALTRRFPENEHILRNGLLDPDPYCRRRALLALAEQDIQDWRELSDRYLCDQDPYIRQAAMQVVAKHSDKLTRAQIAQRMIEDPVEHVRMAAAELLRKAQ